MTCTAYVESKNSLNKQHQIYASLNLLPTDRFGICYPTLMNATSTV